MPVLSRNRRRVGVGGLFMSIAKLLIDLGPKTSRSPDPKILLPIIRPHYFENRSSNKGI
jgi:hypothetical protein